MEYTILIILFTPLAVSTTDPLYKTLAEPVSNPTHFGDTNVPRILVTCAQKSNGTLQIANATITEYFKSITLVTPDKTSGCPYPKTSTMNTRIRTFFSALSSLHQWELDSDDFKGFPGCFHANMKTEYARRVAKWVSTRSCAIYYICT